MTHDRAPMNDTPATPGAAGGALASAALGPSRAEIDRALRAVLADALAIDPERVAEYQPDTGLFGHVPELDSMAVATLFTGIEDRIGIVIEDDEVDGETLETYGALLAFVEGKTILP